MPRTPSPPIDADVGPCDVGSADTAACSERRFASARGADLAPADPTLTSGRLCARRDAQSGRLCGRRYHHHVHHATDQKGTLIFGQSVDVEDGRLLLGAEIDRPGLGLTSQ